MERRFEMQETVVLLVDDEVPFVETLTKRLVKKKLKVIPAYSGIDALEKLSDSAEIQVVILDVKMPGMGGIETLREIKRLHPLTEVIMLTGHATLESAIEGMKLGAFDYLMKPCDIDLLLSKVNEAKGKKVAHEAKIHEAKVKELSLKYGID